MNMRFGMGGNVVSFSAKANAMNYPAISQVDAYWEGLREGRLMPERAEVDPRGLSGALEFAFLLEHVAPGVARLRVAGRHLSDILGMEVRGMPITAFFDPTSRTKLAEVLDNVVRRPQVAELKLKSPAGIGRPPLEAKLYLAPLQGEENGHPRLLGCLQTKGGIGRTPRRFQIQDTHTRRIVASASDRAPSAGAQGTAVNEFSEPAAGFTSAPVAGGASPRSEEADRPLPQRGHLRLVKSDD